MMFTDEQIREIRAAIARVFNVPFDSVVPKARLFTDLGGTREHLKPLRLAIEALRGSTQAAVWGIDRGIWMALGANAAFTFVSGTVVRGGLVDLRAPVGTWSGGDAGIDAGGAALCVLALACALAVVIQRRRAAD